MITLLFWTFVTLLMAPLLAVAAKPERIYQYPYFMAAVFAIFVLPQAVSLIRFPGAAPEQAVETVLVMTCLCLGACLAGYRWSVNYEITSTISRTAEQTRLFHAGLVLVGCGIGFTYALNHTVIQTSETGGWTGPATIYAFFQQLCYPGFAICLMQALRRPGLISIGATVVAAAVPIQSIVLGRREPAVLFLLTIGLTVYFQFRVRPPRWLVLSLIALAMLAIPATATYRRFQLHNDWEAIGQIDLVGNFKQFLNEESVLELRNAAMLIEATQRSGNYEYGAGYWNHLVFRYVPAQILGPAFKQSLAIPVSREGLERELAGMDYTNPPGSTVTAMGDSFQQFGYFGCVFFVVVGGLFRSLWSAAARPNALFAQLFYMQSCTCAMRAVTHWTLDFLPGLLYNVIFLGLAVLYSSAPRCSARGQNGRAPNQGSRRAARNAPSTGQLFTERFSYNKDEHGSAQTSSQQEIKQRVSGCGEHGCD